MQISDTDFLKLTMKVGAVYYFSAPGLIKTNQPHYFIVLHVSNADIITACYTTTKVEKRFKYIQLNKLPESTLVCILPDDQNGLKKASYVDCNTQVHQFAVTYFKSKYKTSGIKPCGLISAESINQIINGIIESPVIEEEIKDLFKEQ